MSRAWNHGNFLDQASKGWKISTTEEQTIGKDPAGMITRDSLGIPAIHGMTLGDPSAKSIDMEDRGTMMNRAENDSNILPTNDMMIVVAGEGLKNTGVGADGDDNKLTVRKKNP